MKRFCNKQNCLDFGSWFDQYYGDHDLIDHTLSQLIKDRDNFLIITLAAKKSGTDRETIQKYLGILGLEKIDALINHNLLKETDGRIFTTIKEFGAYDPESVMAQLKNTADLFNKKNLGKKKAMIGVQTDGVSKDALQEIYKVMADAELRVAEIRKENPSDFTILAGFVLNTLETM